VPAATAASRDREICKSHDAQHTNAQEDDDQDEGGDTDKLRALDEI
jgi:hypothetical protein